MKLSKVSTGVILFLVCLAVIPAVVNFVNYPNNTYDGWWSGAVLATVIYLTFAIFGKGKE
jgi:hypothetical protein